MKRLMLRLRRARFHIRVRITAAATLACLLLTVAGTWIFVAVFHANLVESVANAASQEASAIVAQMAAGATPAEVASTSKQDIVVQVIDVASGSVVATDHPEVRAALRLTPGWSQGVRDAGLDDAFVVAAVSGAPGQLVAVGLAQDESDAAARTVLNLCIIAGSLGCALTGVVVWLSVGRALHPVETLRSQAESITHRFEATHLAVPRGDDELARLAITLNEMLARIKAFQDRQQTFVADASHELRSPLATLRQLADVARRHPHHTTVTELSGEVLSQESRMATLVESMLELARLDEGSPISVTLVDFDDVVMEQVTWMRRSASSLLIDSSAVESVQVRCEERMLVHVVANLLANAARHARRIVHVSLHRENFEAHLNVDDDGEGVPVSDRESIFERFRRLDAARGRDAGGAGLGLAIVSAMVERMAGRVWVEDSPLGGARFVVSVPVAESEPA
ncbi:HAMP domain-containing histidine kinase [Micrococcales bacterium 31B]|nr:HAMP domain-containing histidine kinase [Micrococcales bacterium 31B]